MIRDTQVRCEIEQEWNAVRKLCADSHRLAMLPVGAIINETPPESFYNLPLVLAFAVLERVLTQLGDERAIPEAPGRRPPLGARMGESKEALRWQDYALVERGRNKRNDLAHKATLVQRADCFKFIDAIEVELRAWGVL